MSNAAENKPAVTRRTPAAKEKQKPIAFINWRIADPNDDSKHLLRSTRGFSMFDNEFLTLEDKALIQLAKDNDGVAVVNAELRIVIAQDKPESLDISKIVVKK